MRPVVRTREIVGVISKLIDLVAEVIIIAAGCYAAAFVFNLIGSL